MNPRHLLIGAAWLLAAATAAAQGGRIEVGQAWARATAAGQAAGGGFLKLKNAGAGADRLLSASAPVAERVELHTMAMEGDVMRMRQVDAIALPAGQTVELKPGGLHLMFMGLKQPLQAGSSFPLTLKFEQAGDVAVTVMVEAATAMPAAGHGGHKH